MPPICLSIVVPVYNERLSLMALFRSLEMAPLHHFPAISNVELILVDDGSIDGSGKILSEYVAKQVKVGGIPTRTSLITFPENCGKGTAVTAAIDASHGDIVLIQDADLEYSPKDYVQLLAPIIEDEADIVYGSRFVGHKRRVLFFWHAFFNRLLNFSSNLLNDLTLSDITTCYKAMRGNLARSLRLKSRRFGIEAELATRFARAKARIFEVPISYNGRTYEDGKKFKRSDGLAMFWHVLHFGLFDREPFKPGLSQTLNALDQMADSIYRPVLVRALRKIVRPPMPRILEVGSGLGSITRFLVREGSVIASDIDPDYVRQLKQRFVHYAEFNAICWDINQPPPSIGSFDLVVLFNVLEHIEHDTKALLYLRSMMNSDANLIILVPNNPHLFNGIDRSVGHFRRYTRRTLLEKLELAGFKIEQSFYVNSLAMPGWLIRGIFPGSHNIPLFQIKFYILLKFFLKPLEFLCDHLTGLSVVVTAKASHQIDTDERKVA